MVERLFFCCAEFVEKRCGDDGRWEGRAGTAGERDSPNGWTNYTPCFTPEMLLLIRKLYTGSEDLGKVSLFFFFFSFKCDFRPGV